MRLPDPMRPCLLDGVDLEIVMLKREREQQERPGRRIGVENGEKAGEGDSE